MSFCRSAWYRKEKRTYGYVRFSYRFSFTRTRQTDRALIRQATLELVGHTQLDSCDFRTIQARVSLPCCVGIIVGMGNLRVS